MKLLITLLILLLLCCSLPLYANQLSTAIKENDLDTVTALFAKNKSLVNTPTDEGFPIFVAINRGNMDMLSACIKAGANLSSHDSFGNTPLTAAVESCKPEMVKILLENGVNINTPNGSGDTALILSAACGIPIITILLENGADVAIPNINGVTPLMAAIHCGDFQKTKLLISKGASFNDIDIYGNSMLHYAAKAQDVALVMLALDNGGDAKSRNENGDSPLITLFGFEPNDLNLPGYSILSLVTNPQLIANNNLITLNRQIDSLPEKLQAAAKKELGEAIPDSLTAICTLLLNRGANVNELNDQGNSPLMGAANSGDSALFTLLLAKGADVKVRNEDGVNIAQAVASSGNLKLLKLLLMNGMSLQNVSDDGQTLLHSAVHSGNTEMITYLLDKGFDINKTDKTGRSPIFSILNLRDPDTIINNINLLIAKGAEINLQDISGSSVLFMAIFRQDPDILEALLKQGADPLLENFNGESALSFATENKIETVLWLLKEAASFNGAGDR